MALEVHLRRLRSMLDSARASSQVLRPERLHLFAKYVREYVLPKCPTRSSWPFPDPEVPHPKYLALPLSE
jgi:hypothetical protein